jgi:hypothetical protein
MGRHEATSGDDQPRDGEEVRMVPTALTFVMGLIAAAGFLLLFMALFILWMVYEEGQRRGDW